MSDKENCLNLRLYVTSSDEEDSSNVRNHCTAKPVIGRININSTAYRNEQIRLPKISNHNKRKRIDASSQNAIEKKPKLMINRNAKYNYYVQQNPTTSKSNFTLRPNTQEPALNIIPAVYTASIIPPRLNPRPVITNHQQQISTDNDVIEVGSVINAPNTNRNQSINTIFTLNPPPSNSSHGSVPYYTGNPNQILPQSSPLQETLDVDNNAEVSTDTRFIFNPNSTFERESRTEFIRDISNHDPSLTSLLSVPNGIDDFIEPDIIYPFGLDTDLINEVLGECPTSPGEDSSPSSTVDYSQYILRKDAMLNSVSKDEGTTPLFPAPSTSHFAAQPESLQSKHNLPKTQPPSEKKTYPGIFEDMSEDDGLSSRFITPDNSPEREEYYKSGPFANTKNYLHKKWFHEYKGLMEHWSNNKKVDITIFRDKENVRIAYMQWYLVTTLNTEPGNIKNRDCIEYQLAAERANDVFAEWKEVPIESNEKHDDHNYCCNPQEMTRLNEAFTGRKKATGSQDNLIKANDVKYPASKTSGVIFPEEFGPNTSKAYLCSQSDDPFLNFDDDVRDDDLINYIDHYRPLSEISPILLPERKQETRRKYQRKSLPKLEKTKNGLLVYGPNRSSAPQSEDDEEDTLSEYSDELPKRRKRGTNGPKKGKDEHNMEEKARRQILKQRTIEGNFVVGYPDGNATNKVATHGLRLRALASGVEEAQEPIDLARTIMKIMLSVLPEEQHETNEECQILVNKLVTTNKLRREFLKSIEHEKREDYVGRIIKVLDDIHTNEKDWKKQQAVLWKSFISVSKILNPTEMKAAFPPKYDISNYTKFLDSF